MPLIAHQKIAHRRSRPAIRNGTPFPRDGRLRPRRRHLTNWTKHTAVFTASSLILAYSFYYMKTLHPQNWTTVSHCRQSRTEPRSQVTCTVNLDVWFLRYPNRQTTDIQTLWSQYSRTPTGSEVKLEKTNIGDLLWKLCTTSSWRLTAECAVVCCSMFSRLMWRQN